MNLVEILESNTRKNPTRDCLRADGKGYAFPAVRDMAKKAAGLFQGFGLEKGDRIAVMSQNTVSFVVAFYGTLMAGGVVVPINHKLMAPEVEYILDHSGPKFFLFDASLVSVADKLTTGIRKMAMDGPVASYDRFEDLCDSAAAFSPVEISDGDPAEILYTSGTTGKPKGCVHTHRGVVMSGITGAIATRMDADDRLLMAMPIWHSSPLNNWFAGIQYVGGTTVLIREYHPLHFLQAITQEKCTVYFGAPISYIMPVQMIPDFDSFDLSSMRAWVYGGGPIGADTVRMIMARYKSDRFYQVYGMTESGPTGATLVPKDQIRKAGSIGRSGLPGCDIVVMKSPTREAGPGEVGEIWLKADSMMKGYFNDPEATKNAFEKGWYKSGDVVRIDEDGYMFVVDRIKDMIVTGGENVYSKEVEDVITACPGVAAAAVIGITHPEWGETVTAFVVPARDAAIDAEKIRAFLADRLAKYKVPRVMEIVESLPYTPTGKIMKYKLRKTYRQ
ncbi:MAG: AMP-binding protein [Deltaproteobacteria bacterium]|nr:AMP-binding protein [Deltaproteobacteria bacterium]